MFMSSDAKSPNIGARGPTGGVGCPCCVVFQEHLGGSCECRLTGPRILSSRALLMSDSEQSYKEVFQIIHTASQSLELLGSSGGG